MKITSAGKNFEAVAERQSRDIVRTFDSIVYQSAATGLPENIRTAITDCYVQEFSWEKFASGVAAILADNLNEQELSLLLDFYQDRSVPPDQIDAFKDTLSKATAIQQQAIDYIFANSNDCLDYSSRLIRDYLARHNTESVQPPPD